MNIKKQHTFSLFGHVGRNIKIKIKSGFLLFQQRKNVCHLLPEVKQVFSGLEKKKTVPESFNKKKKKCLSFVTSKTSFQLFKKERKRSQIFQQEKEKMVFICYKNWNKFSIV